MAPVSVAKHVIMALYSAPACLSQNTSRNSLLILRNDYVSGRITFLHGTHPTY
jgi:hypothetical protein